MGKCNEIRVCYVELEVERDLIRLRRHKCHDQEEDIPGLFMVLEGQGEGVGGGEVHPQHFWVI